MFSIKDIFCLLAPSSQLSASNDNAGGQRKSDSHAMAPARSTRCAADHAHADPYLAEACETKRLGEGARLISSVDGNPAAVLNLMATRERTGRRVA